MQLVFESTTPVAQASIIKALQRKKTILSRAGQMKEQIGVLVKSPNPRERYLFRSQFNLAFQLQEHWAYWDGANPGHVERYNTNMETWIDDDTNQMPGSAYGDRMRNTAGHDQIARALEQIRELPETRRAQIVIAQPQVEQYESNDVACTSYLHPFLRDGKLHMTAALRSQDMYWGYPYDTANNQYIQEVMAGLLNVEVGEYWHFMDSCHYYTDYETQVISVAENGMPVTSQDCRLSDQKFGNMWNILTDGLECARRGDMPDAHLDELDTISTFYRDWLGVITAYEQLRFYENSTKAERIAAKHIDNRAWADWIYNKIDTH